MKYYKKIDEEIRVPLGGGYEISYKIYENKYKIITFMIATEYQYIMVFDKKDIEKIKKEIKEYEGIENVSYVDILTSYEIIELYPNCIKLNGFNENMLYDKNYINNFLDKEVKKYFK